MNRNTKHETWLRQHDAELMHCGWEAGVDLEPRARGASKDTACNLLSDPAVKHSCLPVIITFLSEARTTFQQFYPVSVHK